MVYFYVGYQGFIVPRKKITLVPKLKRTFVHPK